MDRLRAPFFWLAGFVLLIALLIECASAFIIDAVHQAGFEAATPGLGIRYLPLLDGLLLYTVVLMGLGILLSRSVVGRVQGIVTLVIAFFGLLGAIVMALAARTDASTFSTPRSASPEASSWPLKTCRSAVSMRRTFLSRAHSIPIVWPRRQALGNKAACSLGPPRISSLPTMVFQFGEPGKHMGRRSHSPVQNRRYQR